MINQWLHAYQSEDTYVWAIVEKNSNEVIGNISADSSYKDLKICEVAYMLGSKWLKRGYGTEALNEILNYLFFCEDFYLIEAKFNSENIALKNYFEKLA